MFIKGENYSFIANNKLQIQSDNNFYYYGLNSNHSLKNIKRNSQKDIIKIINLFYRILLKLVVDKIKKEANRRTLIKAFRDINDMKYPILFYALLKIHKYSSIEFIKASFRQ